MEKMKTLTVSGQTYTVCDPEAVSFAQHQQLTEGQQEQARENMGAACLDDTKAGADAWSGKHTADILCPGVTARGAVVTCQPVEGYPLEVISTIAEYPEGGCTAVRLTRCGKNLADPSVLISGGITESDGAFVGTIDKFHKANRTSGLTKNGVFSEGEQYVISFYAKKDTDASTPYMRTMYTDGTVSGLNIKAVGEYARYVEVTAPGKTVQQMLFSYGAGGTDTLYVKELQIEKGNAATAYAPFVGETFTAEPDAPVYGGSLNWSTGVLTDSDGNTHQLTPQEIVALPGVNTLYTDTGDTEVKGKADPAAIISNLQNRLTALEAVVVNHA